MSSKEYLENPSPNSSPEVGYPELRWKGFGELVTAAKTLLSDLRQEVYNHYRRIPDPNKTQILAKPIELLRSDLRPVVVFTTNYDPAVEEFCCSYNIKIVDGFADSTRREYRWDRYNFDGFTSATENSLALFKLHGSADWFKAQNQIVRSQPTFNAAERGYENLMIYPARRKVAIDEPYFTAYDYLEKCLTSARMCLVIGYSFRDYDTLMRFKAASLSNPDLRITVFDPNATEICGLLQQHGIKTHQISARRTALNARWPGLRAFGKRG
jgi:hypothetical protein